MTSHNSWMMDRAEFASAVGEALTKTLTGAMVESERLSWIDRPASVAEIDNWIAAANATVANLLRERVRALTVERLP